MANIATDSFTGTNGTELSSYSASWVRHSGSASGVNAVIANGRVRATAAGAAMYYHTATPPSADYSVSADIYEASNPSNYGAGVMIRLDTAATTGYMGRARRAVSASLDGWQLYRTVNNTFTQLGSDQADPITTGTSANVMVRANGTTIELLARGNSTPLISVTDSNITAAGKAGIRIGFGGSDAPTDSTLYHVDNFSVDTLDSTTPLSGADTLAPTLGEAAAVQVFVAAAETLAPTLTDAGAVFASLAGIDTLAPALTDAGAVFASVAGAETLAPFLTEAGAVFASVFGAETLATVLVEAGLGPGGGALAGSDVLTCVLVEAGSVLAWVAGADSAPPLTDAAAVFASVASADVLAGYLLDVGLVAVPDVALLALTVRLKAADGTPQAGATVRAYRVRPGGRLRTVISTKATEAVTDAAGVAVLSLLPSLGDAYRVLATAADGRALANVAVMLDADANLHELTPVEGLTWH